MDAAIPEHNGVYGGKWHITSLEGFELKEGLEYLKNGWEVGVEDPKCNYIPQMVISNMELGVALDAYRKLMVKRDEIINLEVRDCFREVKGSCFKGNTIYAMYSIANITVKNCPLTFEDVRNIIGKTCMMDMEIDLSGNKFYESGKDWSQIEAIEARFKSHPDLIHVKSLRMQDCGFSEEEKNKLEEMLRCFHVIL